MPALISAPPEQLQRDAVRRLSWIGAIVTCGLLLSSPARVAAEGVPARPNVIVILTDDHGYDDVGFTGNPVVRTPHLDALAARGTILDRFYAQPVCSPTRAALLTGRYPYRTGVYDTGQGRSMMFTDERTLAETLRQAGYATGIFGKWHLGDNHPLRPMDQGFERSLVHRGGMIGEGGDPLDGKDYFNPGLVDDGSPRRAEGYCNDIFTDAACSFIREMAHRPFFLLFSTNLPHHPLTAKGEDTRHYRDVGLSDETSRFYGLVSAVDQSVGRLEAALRAAGVLDRSIVFFLGDNGTSSLLVESDRWNSGLRGRKTTVYEGGIRVPAFVAVPPRFGAAPRHLATPLSVIDVLPTVTALCGLLEPPGVRVDGRDFTPLLRNPAAPGFERSLFFQWHRGDRPQPRLNMAVRRGPWKLVKAAAEGRMDPGPAELYNLEADPGEEHDLVARHPDVAEALLADYDAWFRDVMADRRGARPAIVLDRAREPVSELTNQSRRDPNADCRRPHWIVESPVALRATIDIRFAERIPIRTAGRVFLQIGSMRLEQVAHMQEWSARFDDVLVPQGVQPVSAWVDAEGREVPCASIVLKTAGEPRESR